MPLPARARAGAKRRSLCFDLENRPSAYWYDGNTTSEITAFGWKWDDEDEVHTMVLTRTGRFATEIGKTISDTQAYLRFRKVMEKADLVYGHNIRRHDLPMLNAGFMRRQMPPLPTVCSSDTCRDLPKTAGMSKNLETMASMYELEGEKYRMSIHDWERANRLEPQGVVKARVRVASDVLLQVRLRDHIRDELGILKEPRRWTP